MSLTLFKKFEAPLTEVRRSTGRMIYKNFCVEKIHHDIYEACTTFKHRFIASSHHCYRFIERSTFELFYQRSKSGQTRITSLLLREPAMI